VLSRAYEVKGEMIFKKGTRKSIKCNKKAPINENKKPLTS
jgi:hypothetical protein